MTVDHSVTVPAGTGGTLIEQFRYVNITPVPLTAGESYQLGAFFASGNDGVLFPEETIGFAMGSGFAFEQSRLRGQVVLANPIVPGPAGPGNFGLSALTSPVPEPFSLAT